MGEKMKSLVLLTVIIAVVTSLPLDQESPPKYIARVDNHRRRVVIEGNREGAGLDRIGSDITETRSRRNVESSNREVDLADLSPAELAKLRIRARAEITGTIAFASPTTLQEAKAEITQYRESIWIRAEGGDGERSIHIGRTVTFNAEELNKLVREQLVKLGVEVDDEGNATAIVESVKMEDAEILASPELAQSKRSIRSQELEEGETGLSFTPRTELAWIKIKIRGKINIKIRFADSAALTTAQLVQDGGSIWTRGEASNRGRSIQIGGAIRFSAEELNAVEIEGVEILPAESPAELNPTKEKRVRK